MLKIYRFWSKTMEDLTYGEEIEVANILCQRCAGLDARTLTDSDAYSIVCSCYEEICNRVGVISGSIKLPIYNNCSWYLDCMALSEDSPIFVTATKDNDRPVKIVFQDSP